MFIAEVDTITNAPTNTYMLIPVIEISNSGEYEFDSSGYTLRSLTESDAMGMLGSDPTVIVNYDPTLSQFQAILGAADAATYSPGSYYSFVKIEAPAEMQLFEPVNDEDDLILVTDIA